MFTDDDRRTLYNALERSLGPAPAAILMAHLPPVGWAELATRGDLVELRGELKAGIAELRGEMSDLRVELKGDIAGLGGELEELRGEVRGLVPKLVAANVASMVGIAGLVLGAVAIG